MSDVGKILESMMDGDRIKKDGFNKIYVIGDYQCKHIIVIEKNRDDAINIAKPYCNKNKVQFIRQIGISFNSCETGVLAT